MSAPLIPLPLQYRNYLTRFAPSPTGYLHLGHVVAAAWVWAFAMKWRARVLLRIEDHDRDRCRPEYEAAILDDLRWLGFFDLPDINVVGADKIDRQTDRLDWYHKALGNLEAKGHQIYGCRCSRSDIKTAMLDAGLSSEEAGQIELRYPGTCRGRALPSGIGEGVRLFIPDSEVSFSDVLHGATTQRPARQCGDLLLRDRTGNFTYQFAVAVDDLAQGVNLIVRGDDLFTSTGRQILLARYLGRREDAVFAHHGLVVGEDGSKLGKRQMAAWIGRDRGAGRGPRDIVSAAAAVMGMSMGHPTTTLRDLITRMVEHGEGG